jgi:hypothetical protein
MNDTGTMHPAHARTFDPRMAESLAREMAVPVELVSRIYQEELEALAGEAHFAVPAGNRWSPCTAEIAQALSHCA